MRGLSDYPVCLDRSKVPNVLLPVVDVPFGYSKAEADCVSHGVGTSIQGYGWQGYAPCGPWLSQTIGDRRRIRSRHFVSSYT